LNKIGLWLGAALVGTSAPALADEGMWTFDNFPAAKVKTAYGVTIDQAWLNKVQKSAVRLSTGCSASVVGAGALVLTNNHCVAECAQDLSSRDHDYYTHGYVARTAGEERKCAGMQAEILTGITDVTGQVTTAGKGLSGEALVKARTAAIGTIEQGGCSDRGTTRCEVVNLYHGGQYKLYRYRKYDDVRLVFSPGVQTAFFGGDPDNFNFPRYDLDGAFLRLYEGGKPVSTPEHLRWNPANPIAGEPVFVAGNPGGTDRQLTIAQLETQRDLTLPARLLQMAELRGRLIRYGEESDENRRQAQDLLFGIENGYKVYAGRLRALSNPEFLGVKRAEEADLRGKLAGVRGKLPADFGDPWATIAKAQQQTAALYMPYTYVAGGPTGSELFDYARTLVRAAAERQKPSADRLPGFADAQLPLLEKQLLDAKPVEPKLEQLALGFWLSKARENLTADSPYTRLLLGRESPESLAQTLSASRLGDPAVRKALWEGGAQAIGASDDPMIRYAAKIDADARRLRSEWNEQVAGPATLASEKIARARFAVYGDTIYPDATFTLRLSYGKVAGWTDHGATIQPFTYFPGLYERATGKPPFELDPRWIAAKDKLDPMVVFDLSTTNDIIGGNSGSPLINAKAEVIGTVFDGNIHSLGGNYGYDAERNRTVAVSAGAIAEALREVYGATALADELERES
jgi:hypothetical protein